MRRKEGYFQPEPGEGWSVYPIHLRSVPIINPDVSIFLSQAYRPRAQECGPDPKLFRIIKRERAMRSGKAFIQMIQSRDMNRV